MIPPRALFYFLLGTLLLAGCRPDDRAGTAIPPLPKTDATQRREAALKLLSTLAARNPGAPDIFYQRARLFLETNQPDKALDDINRAIELKESVGNYFQIKALALRALHREPQALEAARQVEILEAGTPELYVLLGDLYQQTNEFGLARQYLNRALQATPYNGEAYFFQGLITAKTGDTTQALSLFRRALGLNPGYVATYQQLAAIHNALGDLPTAMKYTATGLGRFPNDATLLFQRGVSYQRSMQPDSALVCYRKAVALRPTFFEASFNAGVIAFRQNNLSLAAQFFENVLKQNARVPLLNDYLAQCFEYLGNPEKALEFYTIAMEANPADVKATNGYYRMKRRLEYPVDGLGFAPTSPKKPLLPQRRLVDTTLFRPIQLKARIPKSDSGSRLVPRLQPRTN